MDAFDGALVLQRAVHAWRLHPGPGPAHLSLSCAQAPSAADLDALTHSPPPVLDGGAIDEPADWPAAWRHLAHSLAASAWGLLPGRHRLRLNAGPAHGQPAPGACATQPQVLLDLSIGGAESTEVAAELNVVPVPRDASVVVIGSGLAGAACARALAERGYAVQVLDAGPAPAAGASGLPVGLVAPHSSPDDSLMSRLSRAGVRAMRDALQQHVRAGVDWGDSGVQERRLPGKTRKGGPPPIWAQRWPQAGASWTCIAPPAPDDAHDTTAWWHAKGAWVRPGALVRALLAHPRIRWQGATTVCGVSPGAAQTAPKSTAAARWQIHTEGGDTLEADQVVLACGPHTVHLLRSFALDAANIPMQALRGQLSWGLMADAFGASATAPTHWPATPVNGNGSFVHSIDTPEGPAWFAGSTFDRTRNEAVWLDDDHRENFNRLQSLLPAVAQDLRPLFDTATVRAWAGVRCSVPDRLPMVGRVPGAPAGLWLCSALGSRGLTLAVLCSEVLAAQWTGEPPPLEAPLLRALSSERFAARRGLTQAGA